MIENITPMSFVAFLLSFILGSLCFLEIFKMLFKKKVTIKLMSESMGESVSDKNIIAMFSVVLFVLGISFFSVCLGIYFFVFQV